MGATLSYLGYASHQQRFSRSHEPVSQQLHRRCGQTVILGNGDAASLPIIDLCTHLGALEKDLEICRAENTNKEAVIQYLLQSSVDNTCVKETIEKLKGQLLVLKTIINRTNKETDKNRDRLGKVEDSIYALSTPSVPSPRPDSTSTSFSSCSECSPNSGVVAEDLIDLLDCSQESDIAKLMGEDTTLLDESYEDESDIEGVFKSTTPDQSLYQSFASEFEGHPYITHFADSDETSKVQDSTKASTKKLRVPRGSSDSITPPQQQNDISGAPTKSDESCPGSNSSTSGRNSTATSFSSTSGGLLPLNDVHTKLLNDGLSQLNALDSLGGKLDKSMAGRASSFGTYNQAEPSLSTAKAPTKAQDLQPSGWTNIAEPRSSPEKVPNSGQGPEIDVLTSRHSAQTGTRVPDMLKYGIRYVPKLHEQDVYRTVAISGLLPSVTMMALLEKVRGGMLVDAKLLDTSKIIGSNTALVTFLHERAAKAYEDHAKMHPIAFNNVVAQVSVILTPTWPMPVNIRTSIEEFGHTRCFEVHGIPRNILLPAVRRELTASPVMKSDSLECMRLGADGVLGLRFLSIRAAEQSRALLTKTLRYRGCTVKCIPDPCAQPLETVLEQATDTPEIVEEGNTPKPPNEPEAKAAPNQQDGRLTKVDWTGDSAHRRGRGFETRADPAADGSVNNVAGHRIFPSSVGTGEPLRQETAATIASFATSFFHTE